MPNAFSDSKRVTKSHILAENALIKINILQERITSANESKARLKYGRHFGSKDKNLKKKRGSNESIISDKIQSPEEVTLEESTPEENDIIENSINFVTTRKC